MRKIKFRAWDKQNEEFMEVGRLYQEDDIYCVEEHPDEGDAYGFVGEDIVLMQYTGLKDKNGTEIYEDDVVQISPEFLGDIYRGVIKSAQGCWSIILNESELAILGNTLSDRKFKTEIIGNVHEHETYKEKFNFLSEETK